MIIRHFLLLLTVFLFLSVANIPVYSQTNVGEFGKYKITLEEFEYAYAKNVGGWEAAEEDSFAQYKDFMDLYMNFRMKLRNAQVRSFDTDPELQKELEDYQRQVGKSYIIEKYIIQPGVEELYENRKEELRVSHIMIRPGEEGDEAALEKARWQRNIQTINSPGQRAAIFFS
jgi:peptidyl-prolyl cis-trans isomerase SurA